jgi:hypothetical protein
MPYCTLGGGASALNTTQHILVVRGAMSDRLVLATPGISPVIVGRNSTSTGAASIPATNGTAITVSTDTVLIRDLAVNLGSTGAKGVVATGTGTKVSLLRVTANLGTGLGIDAESGSALSMDECYVTGNSAGGVLVNGASYSIQNTVIAGNGYGVQFTASTVTAGSQFWFDTVVGNSNAVICDPGNPQTLTDSIIIGVPVSCMVTNSVTTMPTLTSSYHLTAHLACPMTPTSSPAHDIDGDSRTPPIDCGADQFVP